MQPNLADIRPVPPRRRLMDIIRPIFDLLTPLHPLLVRLSRKVAQLPGEEPWEYDGHDETGHDNTDDEDEGEVEDNLGGNTANGVRVYEVDVFEAGADVALVSSHELHGNVAAVVRSVSKTAGYLRRDVLSQLRRLRSRTELRRTSHERNSLVQKKRNSRF
jgi:hypothetical protein